MPWWDWLGTAISIKNTLSDKYETKVILRNGKSLRDTIDKQDGWQLGDWNDEYVVLHRKKQP